MYLKQNQFDESTDWYNHRKLDKETLRKIFYIHSNRCSHQSLALHKVIVREADEFGGVLTSPYFLTIMDLFPVSVFSIRLGLIGFAQFEMISASVS